MASSTMAISVTERPIGPPMSCVLESNNASAVYQPLRSLMPTHTVNEKQECGSAARVAAMPTAAKFAAMAAPVPPVDSPGFRSSTYGFRVAPRRADRDNTIGKLMHVRLRNHDRACHGSFFTKAELSVVSILPS